jgi:hypothetical protein
MPEGPWLKASVYLAAILVVLTGIGTADAVGIPPFKHAADTSSDHAVQARSGVPAAYQGTWSGAVRFPYLGQAQFRLTLGSGQPGARVGTLDVSHDCTAQLDLEHGGDEVELKVRLSSGGGGMCSLTSGAVSGLAAYLDVSLVSGNVLDVEFAASPDGTSIGSGSLDRSD